jgi:serine/threonine protein phosphatase PrpC
LSDGLLICANVGDCEALLKLEAPVETISVERNGTIIPVKISNGVIRATVDHNCNNLTEVERVLNTGAKIKYSTTARGLREIDVFTKVVDEAGNSSYVQTPHAKQVGGYVVNASRDPAIYIHGGGVLNMTRSLGDFNAWFLSKEPDITKIMWEPGTKAKLLTASDGYFNCFSKVDQDLEMDWEIPPNQMCQRGHSTVGMLFGYTHADNTTIVVLETGVVPETSMTETGI